MESITVVGAGNGGSAFAAHLGIMGYTVKVLNRSQPRLEAIVSRRGIRVTDAIEGFGSISLATMDPAEAIDGSKLVMVVVPATAHRYVAKALAPHLVDGQIVMLHPGRTGGALEFKEVLKTEGCSARVLLAEAQTLLYACRITVPGEVSIKGVKKTVHVAALPASDTQAVLAEVNRYFPQFVSAGNVLETSLMNMGAVFHPAITIFNASRMDQAMPFKFYSSGVSPCVANVIKAIDEERIRVAHRLGLRVQTAVEWLKEAYGGDSDNLYDLMRENEVYRKIDAPLTLDVRYLWEDVPTGLVPMASLGRLTGIPTPGCSAMVDLVGLLLGCDLWKIGRTADNLGISGMGIDHLLELVEEGL